MSAIKRILNSNTGKIILSVIWGFGLAALFRRACVGRKCIIYKGPHPNQIKDRVFRYGNKCYKYQPQVAKCKKDDEENIKIGDGKP